MTLSRRKPAENVPDLSPEVIAILLAGWGAAPPSPSIPSRGFGGGFLELAVGHKSAEAAMWVEHEVYLRSVAARWGWRPSIVAPDGRRLYCGEARAAGVPIEGGW